MILFLLIVINWILYEKLKKEKKKYEKLLFRFSFLQLASATLSFVVKLKGKTAFVCKMSKISKTLKFAQIRVKV